MSADPVVPGLSQARVLVLLSEQGPIPQQDLRWRSHAAAGTWPGTIRWSLDHGWWDVADDQLVTITAAGLAALDLWLAETTQLELVRSEFRAPDDPYWTRPAGEAGSGGRAPSARRRRTR